MKKRVEILIVEDYSGNPKINEQEIKKSLSHIWDDIVITRLHLPQWTENKDESDLVGVHVIVREVAET
ncbi:hypothetical protein SULI_09440 [Saccharolobus solfataricus]|uniref:Uncharacterized protein n=2 Tax=Saccharolobus solfataricus TaxID=2287 RepID=A0A0E3MDP6_SACSO|nr:hypothetical protein [Saccharolobus solfataricus]AKA74107.1 hypothetical protein SULB_1880 [Saccharolobus solfataricus]AKA76805.1 hypothetical protein SULC_1878 [Saccharolobus solfataricus]AKA79498.1 hypothetical protein SULA_1879 [Saccharolobus solfataricus]AZF68584.1 hypothetical protein SULG_09440 [Saccharolobus solfataricus]AZF71204.1 hypothetical protein SULH_09440 [Saccharolobus solfataricus]